MEPQMPHMQHYAGPVNPQIQSAAMDQQAMNHQNLIRSMDPQSLGRQMEHQPMSIITSDNQTVSRPLELHSLSRPMDSHPLARPIDVNQFHVADTYNIPAIMGMQLSQQHMVNTLEPLHMTAGPMVQPNNEVSRMNQQFHEHIEKEITEKQTHVTQLVSQVMESPEIRQGPTGEITEKSNEDHQHQHMVECQVPPAPVSVMHNDSIQQPAETSVVANHTPQREVDDGVVSIVQPEVLEQQTTQVMVDEVKVYRQEMKSLCEKLSKAGEESVVLTTTPSERKVHKFGSKLGLMFLTGNTGMLDGFLTFCRDQFNAEVTIPSPVLEKKKRGRKKKSEVEQQSEPEGTSEKAASPKESVKVKPAIVKQRKSSRIESVTAKQEPLEPLPAAGGDEEDEDDNNADFDDPADSDYDVTIDTGDDVGSVKVESAGEDEQPPLTRSRKRKSALASKQKKKLVKGKRKGKTLSVQISKLKMKISSDKKSGKEADHVQGRKTDGIAGNSGEDSGSSVQVKNDIEEKPNIMQCSPRLRTKGTCELQLSKPSKRREVNDGDESKYVCEYCQSKFENPENLVAHIKDLHPAEELSVLVVNQQQTEEIENQCHVCKEDFKTRRNLARHMRLHADDCPHKCDKCGSTFLCNADLEKHKKHHAIERPFTCKYCQRKYKVEDSLKKHINVQHESGGNRSVCLICKGLFHNAQSLRRHLALHKEDHSYKEKLESIIDLEDATSDEKKLKISEATGMLSENSTVKHEQDTTTWRNVHSCDRCTRKFENLRDLRNHKKGHDKSQITYDCNECNRVFLNAMTLYRHRQVHGKVYKCKDCDRVYKTIELLQKHSRIHMVNPPFKCEICQKAFYEKRHMVFHIAIHTKEKPYMCDQCGRPFRTPQQLRDHTKTHSEERPHKCEQCGMCFKLRDTLRNHKTTHDNVKNYMCSTCGMTFRRPAHLKKHQIIHTGEKTHFCKVCGKGFNSSSAKKSHYVSFHLKEEDIPNCGFKIHLCEICNKPFGDRQDKNRHMRTHTGEKPYSCQYCGKQFADSSNLRTHVRNHQGDKSQICHICNKGFIFKRDLKKHLASHDSAKEKSVSAKSKTVKEETEDAAKSKSEATQHLQESYSSAYALNLATMQPANNGTMSTTWSSV